MSAPDVLRVIALAAQAEMALVRRDAVAGPLLAQAARAAAIFDRLHLPDVPGQPTLGEAAGDWFRDVVRAVFGSIDRESGIRQVPGVFLLVPKKNSKTTNGAALMLTALLARNPPRC